jgi:hypothetical protein
MRKNSDLSIIILGIFISIVLAVISSYNTPKDSQFGLIVTLIGIVITLFIDIYLKLNNKLDEISKKIDLVNETSKKIDLINAFFDFLQQGDRFSEIIFIWGLRTYSTTLSKKSIRVEQVDAFNFWRDCISHTSQWHAIEYSEKALEKGLWDKRFEYANDIADNVQFERIEANNVIKRIFLFESDPECQKSMKIMKKQMRLGVKVRYAIKKDLENKLYAHFNKIQTLNFALADDLWLYREFYDGNGNITYIDISKEKECVAAAKYIFNLASTVGKEITE